MVASLWHDDRAIEGLPIRLVIALVVGVASLSVMMNTLSGLETLQVAEVDVEPSPDVVEAQPVDIPVTVVDPRGSPVANATVVATGGTATLPGVETATTGPNGTATMHLKPELGPNQADGTVRFDVKPPAGGGYSDRRENAALLVVAG